MTTLLPAIASNPFVTYRESRARDFGDATKPYPPISQASAESLTNVKSYRHFSPVSQRSIASAPLTRNDENISPIPRLALVAPKPDVDSHPLANIALLNRNLKALHYKPWTPSWNRRDKECNLKAIKAPTPQPKTLFHLPSSSKYQFVNDTPTKAKQAGREETTQASNSSSRPSPLSEHVVDAALEPFPRLNDVAEEERFACGSDQTWLQNSGDNSQTSDLATPRGQFGHYQRASNASSAFVHTIKTASMSYGSFSIEPRSIRIERSSESRGCIGLPSRHSLDSDRPTADFLPDDAAFHRGIKRKQIINELILTEESYIADLKALVYLYSTLLASTTTISNQSRMAVQRNISELLHIHENLLNKIRYSTYKAAARKWADTEIPTRLGLSHCTRRRNANQTVGSESNRKRYFIRSSIDSADVSKTRNIIGTAEPAEVLDLAEILNSSLTQFYAYEEYCANHEVIAHELQKQVPCTWVPYESGMESLNQALTALDRREHQHKKGMTVGDLLIKPIQRICRYPLLLEDLLKQTPVVDGPAAHKTLDKILNYFRGIAQAVNLAADNSIVRAQVQRKWLLRDYLTLSETHLTRDQFRSLGSLQLCGVLFATYQDVECNIHGQYSMCVLFDNHFLIAIPRKQLTTFDSLALISLPDLRIETSTGHNGLLSVSSLHTWKIAFTAEGDLHEIMLSACCRTEEKQWVDGLRGKFRPGHFLELPTLFDQSKIFCKLKCHGTISYPFIPLSCRSPVRRTEVSNERLNTCPVILRNTYNPQDWQEFRHISPLTLNRLQDHVISNEIVTLSPKRAERTRLETSLTDVYTKDRLPFPGMIGSKGSQIIRASAGSLVRKLSFASMQASFSRRSASLSSRRSYHTIHTIPPRPTTFSIRKQSLAEHTPSRHGKPRELPELDTMDSLIGRMIGNSTVRKRLSFSGGEKLVRKNTSRMRQNSTCQIGPDDPASIFYKDDQDIEALEKKLEEDKNRTMEVILEQGTSGTKKKRWSNPISKLKAIGGDGIMNMLYSSK